jgi:hypothetical protein
MRLPATGFRLSAFGFRLSAKSNGGKAKLFQVEQFGGMFLRFEATKLRGFGACRDCST